MSELSGGNVSLISPIDIKKGHGLTHTLNEMPDGHTLLVGNSAEAPGLVQANYMDRPDYKNGRGDSIQRVEFADLTISTDRQTDRGLTTQPVAIKPYPRAWMAARDFRLANQLNSEGKVTFEPLGFTKIDGKVAGLTRFEQGVTSFDNILWSTEAAPSDQQVRWALSCAAATLTFLHGKGYTHGDFQVKNTAHDINLEPRVIDITTVRKKDDFEEDIATYLESLTRFGTRHSPVEEGQVDEYFLNPYEEMLPEIFTREQASEMRMNIQAVRYILNDFLTCR